MSTYFFTCGHALSRTEKSKGVRCLGIPRGGVVLLAAGVAAVVCCPLHTRNYLSTLF